MSEQVNIEKVLVDKSSLVPFDRLNPESFAPAVNEQIARLKNVVNEITHSKAVPSWTNVVLPLEDASEDLGFIWSIISHLNSVVETPQLRTIVNSLLPAISQAYSELGQNELLYAKYKALKNQAGFEKFSSAHKRIIDREIQSFVLSGAELNEKDKEKVRKIDERKSALSQKFSENLLDCTNDYSLMLPEDTDLLKGMPQEYLDLFAQQARQDKQSGYKITLHMPHYLPVMQYAENRELREKLYRAYCTRASEFSPAGKDNAPIIEELLVLRQKEAKLLGFQNFAECSLVPKMAESPQQVVDFLRELAAKAKPAAKKDMEELIRFGKEKLGIDNPQAWDVAYISEKLREDKYAYSSTEVKKYFTEPAVLKGMFSLVEKMFSIRIEPSSAPVWHKDVKYFVIKDAKSSKEIASFYTDLYARNGKRGGAWMNDMRSRRLVNGKIQTPVAYLICNFAEPVGDQPSLLTLSDVETIFHEFGHGLHHMLTRQTDLAVSGINGVEWDAVEMPSQFMENFVWDWEVMQSITKHVSTGKKMPKELFDKLVKAKNFQAGMANVRQIEFALFDMLLHMDEHPQRETVEKLLTSVRKEVAVNFPPSYNRFANSFSHIFAGGYSAGYYSYKWAEVLSADAFSLFEEKGIFNSEVGQKWLDEILSQGGSRPAMESFIAFRGRKPSIDPLLRHYGLVEEK